MARVANCPQCEHDLLVPDNAEPSALVKCPQCKAFFELQHAESRDLPAALIVQSHTEPSGASLEVSKSPTVDNFSSVATLKGDVEPISEEELKVETGEADVLDFADEEPAAGHGSASLPAPRLADEPQEYKQPGTESHEEAAQRIDQWFRSAKTLSDMPPLDESDLAGQSSPEMLEPTNHPTGGAPTDIDRGDAASVEDAPDFELEAPSDLPRGAAPWDDSQHMDRLLSDFEGRPIDTFEPVGREAASTHEEQEHFQPASDWTPDESLSIPSTAGKPERKRSILRTLVVSVFGGIIGLGLGYYALLWLGPVLNRGKEIDFLELAHYLPKSVLPPVFRTEMKPAPAVEPSKMVDDLAASEKVVQPEPTTPAEPEPVAPPAPADSTAKTPVAPAEKQATFTTPAEPAAKSTDTDDRYAIPTAKSEPGMREPAPLEEPSAKAITENIPKVEPVRINNAPSFAAADVTTSLEAADVAQAGLVAGNLQDGKEVARTKGVSYMAIADFAQKATFSDAADAAKSQQQADAFFRKLLSNAHTRDEVAQIAPRWLSHPKRPQNGVFFAGNVTHVDTMGTMVEYHVELNAGPSVIVVVPMTDRSASISGPKGPVAIVGSIIDKPADEISGYTGKAPQVVFAKKLLPLE